jgi:hypothetical protein
MKHSGTFTSPIVLDSPPPSPVGSNTVPPPPPPKKLSSPPPPPPPKNSPPPPPKNSPPPTPSRGSSAFAARLPDPPPKSEEPEDDDEDYDEESSEEDEDEEEYDDEEDDDFDDARSIALTPGSQGTPSMSPRRPPPATRQTTALNNSKQQQQLTLVAERLQAPPPGPPAASETYSQSERYRIAKMAAQSHAAELKRLEPIRKREREELGIKKNRENVLFSACSPESNPTSSQEPPPMVPYIDKNGKKRLRLVPTLVEQAITQAARRRSYPDRIAAARALKQSVPIDPATQSVKARAELDAYRNSLDIRRKNKLVEYARRGITVQPFPIANETEFADLRQLTNSAAEWEAVANGYEPVAPPENSKDIAQKLQYRIQLLAWLVYFDVQMDFDAQLAI